MVAANALLGSKFNNLLVVGLAEPDKNRMARWICQCDCGVVKTFYAANVTRGLSKSCGCMKPKAISAARSIHGHSKSTGRLSSPTYSSWSSMWTRCTNENCKSYKDYGGRGITVCDSWRSFEKFLADMGGKPEKWMSIERIDCNGNYEPGNCIWANPTIQARNTRRTKLTTEIVSQIRAGKISTLEVMQQTGCAKSTVGMAKRCVNWSAM